MSVRIKNPETLELVRRLTAELGVGPTKAIGIAVSNALAREREAPPADEEWRVREIEALQERVAAMPVLDPRPWRDLRNDLLADDGAQADDAPSAAA